MQTISQHFQNSKERYLVNAFLFQHDERAFRKLYRHYTPILYQLVLRLLAGDEHETQEVVQEMWVRAVQRMADFRWESSFRTWLSGIAINRCREQFRLHTKRKDQVQIDELELAASIEPGTSIDSLDLESAIVKLPEGYRQVLILHDIQGYKHEEIGRLLNFSTGTSKSQLSHARRAMRRLLHARKET